MPIEINALVPFIQPLIQRSSEDFLQRIASSHEIGQILFGNKKAPVELNLSTGTPVETPDEFLHDFIEIGTHKIFIYMRCHGKWVKRINKGMIVYTDVFLDYPKCTRCGQYAESSHYIEKENFFGFKYKACKVRNLQEIILPT